MTNATLVICVGVAVCLLVEPVEAVHNRPERDEPMDTAFVADLTETGVSLVTDNTAALDFEGCSALDVMTSYHTESLHNLGGVIEYLLAVCTLVALMGAMGMAP